MSIDKKIELIRVLYNTTYGGFKFSNNYLLEYIKEYHKDDVNMDKKKLLKIIYNSINDDYRYGNYAKLYEKIYINNEFNLPLEKIIKKEEYTSDYILENKYQNSEYKDWITTLSLEYVPKIFKNCIRIKEYDGLEDVMLDTSNFDSYLLKKIMEQKELKQEDIEYYNNYRNIINFYYSNNPNKIKKEEFDKYYTVVDE